MLVLTGPSALSDLRLEQLIRTLTTPIPDLRAIVGHYVHFVDLERELGPEQGRVLARLLDYGEPAPQVPSSGVLCLVIPRPGTISPWSSKATDIAHNCGLAEVRRIERGVAYYVDADRSLADAELDRVVDVVHDRMTEVVVFDLSEGESLFSAAEPRPMRVVDISANPRAALEAADREMGLALSADEIDYLVASYQGLGRSPTDVELMMFAQANSEHCRHKVFNAGWVVDHERQERSLFQMIRNTYRHAPDGILSAYRDNAAVVAGWEASMLAPEPESGRYRATSEPLDLLMKVETHNHPTAISPFPGAATGAGGEIRDEAATGQGGRPKAGLTGFATSNLRIPGFEQPWEQDFGRPGRIVSALDIMLEGPVGAASFNNEFGRPAINGYFRTFEAQVPGPGGNVLRGYHKPIMVAGGMGSIRRALVDKADLPPGAPLVVLGGPAMLIGLGGGAASSMTSGASSEELDFASVQRSNPEMQRRCQEVIDRCTALGTDNPILSVHDVGAGGLSNALPELVHGAGRGARFEMRLIPSDEPALSPMEIWCNEAQERYVLAIAPERLGAFEALCARERCPCAVVGEATEDAQLVVGDGYFDNTPVDLPMELLLGKPPQLLKDVHHQPFPKPELDRDGIELVEAVERVLRLPACASKGFLVTIGDRSVTGLVARDPMVGPWQVPVADVGVTLSDYRGYTGEAMAVGERPPVALLDHAASARMAVAEAITNIAAARIDQLAQVRLSANWMAASGYPGEDAGLYDAVRAVGEELCPRLGITVPVGKDSLSMETVWQAADGDARRMAAPLSLVVSAFAPVADAWRTLDPQLRRDVGDTDLILIDLGKGQHRLGGSALAQVYAQLGHHPPDLDDPAALRRYFQVIQELNRDGLLLAYHDRSDGGLLVTLCEMAFAGHTGLSIRLDELGEDPLAALFSEELGGVIQVRHDDTELVLAALREYGLGQWARVIGRPSHEDRIRFSFWGRSLLDADRSELHRLWAETSFRMQALRDHPDCAREELEALADREDPGLNPHLTFDPSDDVSAPYLASGARPRVAILREQGVNGQVEMAAAFERAGFEPVDVHMSDIVSGEVGLVGFTGLAACGGFSYGDVLGAGGGWAKSVLFNHRARDEFAAFFERGDSFGLGVCNGCQMLSQLRELIPGAGRWPTFVRNRSEQFEARLSQVEVLPSHSIFFDGMAGSRLPIAVAHGEGRARLAGGRADEMIDARLVTMRYVDGYGRATERYPDNPNGSPGGITGLTTADGRFTIMMPHPERVFRTVQHAWAPADWDEDGPWLRLFRNARTWVG